MYAHSQLLHINDLFVVDGVILFSTNKIISFTTKLIKSLQMAHCTSMNAEGDHFFNKCLMSTNYIQENVKSTMGM